MKRKIYRCLQFLLSFFIAFTMPVFSMFEVHADGLDVNQAINEIIGGNIGNTFHYSYQGGQYFDQILTSNSSEELYNIGLDCTSGTLAIVSKAIRNANGDPYKYFGECREYLNTVYPYELATHFTNMEQIASGIVDVSVLEPGDIIVYGQMGEKGHMNVYCGNGQTFDFGSNGKGATANYRGFANYITYKTSASSTTGSYPISAVYRIHLNKKVQYEIVKLSTDPLVSATAQYSLAGAVFRVYTSSDCNEASRIDTLTSDASGHARGEATVSNDVNTLYVKEISAPENFRISDASIHTVMIQDGSAYDEFKDEPMYADGSIEISKIDQEGKKNAASMAETHFTITYYDSFDINGTATNTFTIKTLAEYDESGVKYVARMDDAHLVEGAYIRNAQAEPVLPMGTYVIRETKAASDYTMEGGYFENGVRVGSQEQLIFIVDHEGDSIVMKAGNRYSQGMYEKEELVKRGSYELQKKDKDLSADPLQPVRSLGDATFAYAEFDLFYLGNGSEDASMMIDHDGDGIGDGSEFMPSFTTPVDHIQLDEKGYYSTPNETYLAYGNYRLVETKSPVGYSKLDGEQPVTIDFSITEDKEKKYLEAIEKVYEGDIQIVKTQNYNQSSSFTKPEQGAVFDIVLKKYVLQEANGREVDRQIVLDAYDKANTWSGYDASNHFVNGYADKEYDQITTDVNGCAKTKMLAYGDYYLVQVSSANEMKIIEDVQEFSITQEHQPTLQFYATNNVKGYVLKIFKKDADTNERVTFTSSAFKIHMLKDMNGNDVSHSTTKDTSLSTRLVNGYVVQTLGENSEKTNVDVFMTASKTMALSNDKLEEGVFYGVNNNKKDNVDSCTSLPVELYPGEYQLEEVVTSDGYITSSPLPFTIRQESITRMNDAKQNIIEIEFKNTRLKGDVFFNKEIVHYENADTSLIHDDLTQFGFTLYAKNDIYSSDTGALIVRKDEKAKRLTTDINQPYASIEETYPDTSGNFAFTSLPLGEYYLKETTVPDGFVNENRVWDITIEQSMFDHYIEEQTTLPLHLGEVTDRSIEKDDVRTVIQGESTNTYKITNDVTKVSISKKDITNDEELEGAQLSVLDENENVVDTWISKNQPHTIEGLKENGTYTLREDLSPLGYYQTTDISFTVNQGKLVQQIEMKDAPVMYKIQKVDENGNIVSGVKLKLFDRTDQEEIPLENDGITTEKPFILDKVLKTGHTYELIEEEIVAGVFQAANLTFVVPKVNNDAACITITMVDETTGVFVNKVDQYGNGVVNAKLEILEAEENENGEVYALEGIEPVYAFTTDGRQHDISSYVKGSDETKKYWYILREVESPFGYAMMEDIAFYVTGTKENVQFIQAMDMKKDVRIKVVKKDASSKDTLLKGATFTLYDKDHQIVKDKDGNDCILTTDDSGTVQFEIPYDEGYYIQETKAPQGYQLNQTKFDVVYPENYTFLEPLVIQVEDKPNETVNTEDQSKIFLEVCVLISSITVGGVWMRMKHVYR